MVGENRRRAAASPAAEQSTGRPHPQLQRVEITGLTKSFGGAAVLRGLDLEIVGGEFISLLGPSGCGKTTALNCLAGLVKPDAGSIRVDGQELLGLPPERRRFGMVFQNYALFPHLTVAGNVAFGLEMQGVHRREVDGRVREALALVQLDRFGDRHPSQMSGGQQQRVALARTLVTRPRLVLMDEPLSNLDAKLRAEMRMEIRRLHLALGLTTILVTHDQQEALSLSDRIVLLRDGRTEQVGTPEEIYSDPRTAYVASFLGYRNILPVSVAGVDGDAVRISLAGVQIEGTARGAPAPEQPAVAAVRPEDVQVAESGDGIRARVEVTEFIGDHFEIGVSDAAGQRLVARSGRRWPIGAQVVLSIAPNRLFVFAEESE